MPLFCPTRSHAVDQWQAVKFHKLLINRQLKRRKRTDSDSAGHTMSLTTDQKVWGSNPYGRATHDEGRKSVSGCGFLPSYNGSSSALNVSATWIHLDPARNKSLFQVPGILIPRLHLVAMTHSPHQALQACASRARTSLVNTTLTFVLCCACVNSATAATWLAHNEEEIRSHTANLLPGDELIIAEGAYRNVTITIPDTNSGTLEKPIIVRAERPGRGYIQWFLKNGC